MLPTHGPCKMLVSVDIGFRPMIIWPIEIKYRNFPRNTPPPHPPGVFAIFSTRTIQIDVFGENKTLEMQNDGLTNVGPDGWSMCSAGCASPGAPGLLPLNPPRKIMHNGGGITKNDAKRCCQPMAHANVSKIVCACTSRTAISTRWRFPGCAGTPTTELAAKNHAQRWWHHEK